MKDLYKPVFWCGFALSLSALYFSSEQAASGSDGEPRKPVLMQISIGEAHQVLRSEPSPVASPPLSVPTDAAPVITNDPFADEAPSTPVSAPSSTKTSAFFSAAQEAMSGR